MFTVAGYSFVSKIAVKQLSLSPTFSSVNSSSMLVKPSSQLTVTYQEGIKNSLRPLLSYSLNIVTENGENYSECCGEICRMSLKGLEETLKERKTKKSLIGVGEVSPVGMPQICES